VSPSSTHLQDNAADRALGEHWERQFCLLAAHASKAFTPQQIGREKAASWGKRVDDAWKLTLLPDVTVWTAPGEHHEINHKAPTRTGCYGLEVYRLDALVAFREETQQPVLYTIHDWCRTGAVDSREAMPNRLGDWLTIDVLTLDRMIEELELQTRAFDTWVNGQRAVRPGYYWPAKCWVPLETWWASQSRFECA